MFKNITKLVLLSALLTGVLCQAAGDVRGPAFEGYRRGVMLAVKAGPYVVLGSVAAALAGAANWTLRGDTMRKRAIGAGTLLLAAYAVLRMVRR